MRSGRIDRRVLATLEFLAASGLRPTVTALEAGHSTYTTAGNVSEHSSGNAVDIAKINGITIIGHQDKGGITEQTVRNDEVKTGVAWRAKPSRPICSVRECSRESWIGRRKS